MEPRASAVSQQTEFRMPVSRNSRMFQFSKWYENHEPVDQFSRKLVFECKLWILMLSYQLASPQPSIGFGGTRLTSPVFLPLSWRYWCKSITDHYHISQTLPTLNLAAALHLQPPSKSRRQKLTMCGLLASGGWSIWSLKIKIADKIYFFLQLLVMLPWFTHQGFSLEWQGNIYSLKSWFDDLQDLPLLISSTFSPCLQHLSLVDDLFLDCSLQPPSWLLPLPFGTFSSGGFLSWTTFPLKKEGIIPRAGLTDPILAVGVPIYIIWLTSTVWRAAVSEQWLMFLGAAIFMVIWTISFILVFLWCSVQSGRFLLLSKLWAINPQYQVSDCLIGINLFYTPIPHSQVHYVDIFGPYVILYIHLSVYFELLPGMDHGNLPSGAVPDHNNSSPQQWQCER